MNVFLLGAAGYIGGSVATVLRAAGHDVRGLVRSAERAAQVRAHGIEPVIGTLADAELIAGCARAADAVVHAANADDRPSVEAILGALAGTGKPFIHTSGSGIVADAAGGEATDRIYDDDTPVLPLPARAARVALNADILAAAATGLNSVVIAPPMIYGRGTGVTTRRSSARPPARSTTPRTASPRCARSARRSAGCSALARTSSRCRSRPRPRSTARRRRG
jgi:nucleoside-diphosphate-sugar epimerase